MQTTDDRVFTTTVTPWTDRVDHNYTLRLVVAADTVTSAVGSKANEEGMLEVRVATPWGDASDLVAKSVGESGQRVGAAELEPAVG